MHGAGRVNLSYVNLFRTFLPWGKIEKQKKYVTVLSNSKKYFQKRQECDNFFYICS